MKRLVLSILVPFLLCASCVKEERGDCPCYLILDFDELIDQGAYSEAIATLSPSTDRVLYQQKISIGEYEGRGYEIRVPKDVVKASVICGFKNVNFAGDRITVPYNEQSDPVMAFGVERVVTGERDTLQVALHKQFCNVDFRISGLDTRTEFPYELRVCAECNGLRLPDLSPLAGGFSAMAVEDDTQNLSLRVPRQQRNIMSMEVLDKRDGHIYSVNLGEMLDDLNYDWNKADLDDIELIVDFVQMTIEVVLVPWDKNNDYETIDI